MRTADAASEWLRLAEHYRQMTDEELLSIAREALALTDSARQVLVGEMSKRGLAQPAIPPPTKIPETQPDSPYVEDRELVEICSVWSLSDAIQLQTSLDRAGIPFYMGPEKAIAVDAVTSNFVEGVSVQIMCVGLPWALQALREYEPKDEPPQEAAEQWKDAFARCPKCSSPEVVFERLSQESLDNGTSAARSFEWRCDSCGHHWRDEGIVQER
jgi:DNA-directed RNA polymerase subunit M/transcription elongation factor TFIIS